MEITKAIASQFSLLPSSSALVFFFPSCTVCFGILCQEEIILYCRGKTNKCKLNVCQNSNCSSEKGQKCPVVISSFEGAKKVRVCVCEVLFVFLHSLCVRSVLFYLHCLK